MSRRDEGVREDGSAPQEAPVAPAALPYEPPRILAKRSVERVTLLSDTTGEGGTIGGE